MGLIVNTGRIPSWFKEISSIPNLSSLLISPSPNNISITPPLSSLIGKFVDKIDEVTHFRLRNKYYWIAGLDSSNSLIFGRAFYTLDDSSGTRVIYFSHWIPTSHDRMILTPCPGCFLHCLVENEGPLALKSVVPLDPTHCLTPAFALSSGTHFHIVGAVHEGDLTTSYLNCAWIQTLDNYILKSGVFSCPMVSPFKDFAELTFIIYVLNSLPSESVVDFSSILQLNLSYQS
ncbi:unnamed protein product [Rhizophagus irregularis]|nr:unnamed protein product [Rhizophagus irregularis]